MNTPFVFALLHTCKQKFPSRYALYYYDNLSRSAQSYLQNILGIKQSANSSQFIIDNALIVHISRYGIYVQFNK